MQASTRAMSGGRRLVLASLLVVAALAMTSPAAAQPFLGPHAGFDVIEDEFSIGVQGGYPVAKMAELVEVVLYPNIDLFIFGDVTILGFDVDVIFPFTAGRFPLSPYPGIGIGITHISEAFAEETLFDLNIVGGIEVATGTLVEPFVEVEASLFGTDSLAFILGVNFYPTFFRDSRSETVEEDEFDDLEDFDDEEY